MVLTNAQRTTFFTDPDQLGIPEGTFAEMANEGITTEADLVDFVETTIKQLADNLCKPLTGPPGHAFGAKSHKRLLVACDIMQYYVDTRLELTASNLRWIVLKNFEIQWKAMKDKAEDGDEQGHSLSSSGPSCLQIFFVKSMV